jgi:hypothetical protein
LFGDSARTNILANPYRFDVPPHGKAKIERMIRQRILLSVLLAWALVMIVPDVLRVVQPLASFGFHADSDGLIYDVTGPFDEKEQSPAWNAAIRTGDWLALKEPLLLISRLHEGATRLTDRYFNRELDQAERSITAAILKAKGPVASRPDSGRAPLSRPQAVLRHPSAATAPSSGATATDMAGESRRPGLCRRIPRCSSRYPRASPSASATRRTASPSATRI